MSKVIKLTPPVISNETILEKIVGIRPVRKGCFNITKDEKKNKLLFNNYGHGGSGWTSLFGSVNRSLELFRQEKVPKKTPIKVVGAGCMGLTTAVELHLAGYENVSIVAKELYDIASWIAAGYFAMVSIKTSPFEEKALHQIGIDTLKTLKVIQEGKHPYIPATAVKLMTAYSNLTMERGVEYLEQKGLLPSPNHVTIDFGNGVIYPNYLQFKSYFMNTTQFMKELHKTIQKLKIPITIQTLTNFDQVNESVIFDCAGMGAKELNYDLNLTPVRGHLVVLKPHAFTKPLDYMIYTDFGDDRVYMLPKTLSVTSEHKEGIDCACALGGTFIPHCDPKNDPEEFQKLLDRNSLFFHGKPFP